MTEKDPRGRMQSTEQLPRFSIHWQRSEHRVLDGAFLFYGRVRDTGTVRRHLRAKKVSSHQQTDDIQTDTCGFSNRMRDWESCGKVS